MPDTIPTDPTTIVWVRVLLMFVLIVAFMASYIISYLYIYLPIHSQISGLGQSINSNAQAHSNEIEASLQGLESDADDAHNRVHNSVNSAFVVMRATQKQQALIGSASIDNTSTMINVGSPPCQLLESVAADIDASVGAFQTHSQAFITGLNDMVNTIVQDIENAPNNIRCSTLCFLMSIPVDLSNDDLNFFNANCPACE